MDILVSFCNSRRTPGRPLLGLLDTTNGEFRLVRRPSEVPRCVGINGLAASDGYLYAIMQEPAGLLVFDRADLRLLTQHLFRSAMDPHSLWVSDEVAYVVSTGTDELLALRLRGPEVVSEEVFWRPDPEGPRADLHHLNAVYGWRGDLLVSGFGKKAGQRWSTALDGFIVNVSRGKQIAAQIHHPHSLVELADTLVYCESTKNAVRVVGRELAQEQLPGFTRGLAIVGSSLYVGTSTRRKVSKSTGLANPPSEPDADPGRCGVTQLALDSFAIEKTIDLSAYGDEIYDLLPVEETGAWPAVAGDQFDAAAGMWSHQMDLAAQEIARLVPPSDSFILVDGNQWQTDPLFAGRRRILYVERDGQYWGAPPNDPAAIGELERLRDQGAGFMVFGWPAFWWLDYYTGLRQHLRAHFPCLLENDRLVVFALRQ